VRNIADAVHAHDGLRPARGVAEKRETFFGQPWERSSRCSASCAADHTEIVQEINRYADSEVRYTDAAEQREFEQRTRQIVLEVRARKAATGSEI
jgi:hypothetical protein